MKLFEIINTQHNPRLHVSGSSDRYGKASSFARVADDPEDPHMVDRETSHEDPHTLYIQALQGRKQLMASNPYFPRVYEMNDSSGRVVAKMEKLFEMETASHAEINVFSEQIVGVPIDELQQKMLQKYAGLTYTLNQIKKNPFTAVVKQIELFVNTNDLSKIVDPLFVQALKIIEQINQSEKGVFIDMHSENYMIRRGPTGAQLVITDPIAGQRD